MSPIRIVYWTFVFTAYGCLESRRFWRDFNQAANEVIEKAERKVR